MPWPDDHKSNTRARIVAAAAAALRTKGVAGVSVAEIMADAGLTQGGFYAHFASKDELVGAAVEQASAETLELLSGALDTASEDQRVHAVIDKYLSGWHAESPGRGCPLPALSAEVSRLGGKPRRQLAGAVEDRIAWLRELLPADTSADADAIGAVACMIGGILLSRVVDRERAATVLDATRAFAHRALQARAPRSRRPKKKRVR
jgi:TetR/AcrR family transcriptional regulator, transcriptional repressor for nem operon